MNGREVSMARAVRGPIILITVGALFALNNFTPYRFDQTWPVLLIVFGLLTLLRRGIDRRPPDQPYPFAPPNYAGGGYRQSQYPGTIVPPPPPPPPMDASSVK